MLAVAAAAVLVLIVLPLLSLVWGSLTADGRFTLEHFGEAPGRCLYLQALWNSLVLGAWTAVLSVAIGLPMAWAVGRTDVPVKRFVHLTAVIAYITPPYLTAIAFVNLLGPNAAKAFAEFMIGDTVQKMFPTEGIYAARSDIPPPAGSPPLSAIKLMPVDYERIEKDAKSLKDRFNEIYQ